MNAIPSVSPTSPGDLEILHKEIEREEEIKRQYFAGLLSKRSSSAETETMLTDLRRVMKLARRGE